MRVRRALLLVPAIAITMAVGLLASPVQAAPATVAPAAVGTATAALASASSPVKTHRSCGTAAKGHSACLALQRIDLPRLSRASSTGVSPKVTPYGLAPANLQSAYALPVANGAGQTVAIVDAFNDPTAAADLAIYRTQYGLPACTAASGCFQQVNQNGLTSPLPANNTGWAAEEGLDIDMVSAACPACKILLVEAASDSNVNLDAAVSRAVALGAKFVSLSWGGAEYSGETTEDSVFNHPGVAITVAAGDNGAGASYPATSRYVIAVGGTHLSPAANVRGWAETAWSGSGSGCSRYEAKPSWQTVTTNCSMRAEADVSAVADPATGVAVYQSYGASGWQVYGGTSASAPIIAAAYALAGTPAPNSQPVSFPYSRAGALNDVTAGGNGTCAGPICAAGTGWDGPSGLGTPHGVTAFSGSATSTNTITVSNPGAQTATTGTPFSLQVHAADSATTQTMSYAASGLPAGLTISSAGLISGTPTTSGTVTATVTVTDATAASGSASFVTTVAAGAVTCTSAPSLANPGFEAGTAPWVQAGNVVSANGNLKLAYSGTHFAWFDGYGRTHTDTLSQTVTIPAGCSHTTLTFWLRIDTAEVTQTTAYDQFTIKAGSTTLASYSNLNHGGYTQKTVPLGAFAGQTVTLIFTGVEDSLLATSFILDDAAVMSS